jgi:hypothetical protein
MQTVSPNGTRGANSSAQLPHGNANGVPQIDEQMIRSLCRCSNPRCDCQKAEGNVHCPAHDDNSPSLSVTTTGDGKTLFKCHSGCTQDAVLNALRGVPAPLPSIRSNIAQKPAKSRANGTFSWQHATIYPYTDETDATLFEVGRIGNGAEKRISQRKPNGRGGWLYQLTDVRRVLYRLPEVLAAQIVFICEGEKAADAVNGELAEAGLQGEYIATTSPHGAGKWRDEYAAILSGKTVCVLPDNDEQGSSHADAVCRSCGSAGAGVKRLELPKLPVKGDAADFLSNGGTVEKLIKLFEAAAAWLPSTSDTTEPKQARRYPRLTLGEIFARPRLDYLIQGIFVERGTGVISADYGGFKSFLALDMGLCVATGRSWMGRATKQGGVVYITPEGSYQHADRVRAWMRFHNIQQLPQNFEIIELPVQIGDATQRQTLIDELREMNPAFVIFDTVAKCNVGRDENDSATAGLFTDGMEQIARELNSFVLAIHHNNKQGTARGSNALPANVDASVTLKCSSGRVVTINCDRVKGAPFEAFSLIGRIVETGEVDEHGAPFTSLVFEPTDAPTATVPQADQTREKILSALREAGPNGLTATEWQQASGLSPSRFYDYRDQLTQPDGPVTKNGRRYQVTPITPITPNRSESEREFYSDYSDDALASEQSEFAGTKSKRRPKNSPDAEPYGVTGYATADEVVI